jgi:hypothetical protein
MLKHRCTLAKVKILCALMYHGKLALYKLSVENSSNKLIFRGKNRQKRALFQLRSGRKMGTFSA